jgi:outer membrane protein OmpA-like peptidoglycan-associated protein
MADEVRRQVIETLRLAWMAGTALEAQLEYLDDHVGKAEQTVASYREEFFIGQRDLIDLLDAESERNSARISRANAHYDALAANFRTHEAVGRLFGAVGLEAQMSEDDFTIARVQAAGSDSLPFEKDEDWDKKTDTEDHCENSLPEATVDAYGCSSQPQVQFGFTTIKVGEVNIEYVTFEYDTAVLTPESRARLDEIIAAIRRLPESAITVSAHTDERGSAEYNQELSERRALAVRQILVERGISAGRILAVGYGESQPIADNGTEEGRRRNRRVEFLVERN